jgi:hypothetical protein
MPGIGDTVAVQQKEFFEAVHANASILKGILENEIGIVQDEIAGIKDFLQARLRSAMFEAPEKERTVQDAIEQLLIGRGLQKGQDYDRETGRVKVSVKEVIPDFVFPKLAMALEVKLITTQSRLKEAVDEINADILAYARQYATLVFLVYDLGMIRDHVEFRHDLEAAGNVSVILVKH